MRMPRLPVAIAAAALVAAGCISESVPPPSPLLRATATASPRETPTIAESTESAASDPVPRLTVADAITVRDGGVDHREIDVSGFLSPMPRLACPLVPANLNPTRLDCPQSFQWLMANPERLQHRTTSGFEFGPPTGPAFRPSFAFVDQPMPVPWRSGDELAQPVAIEVIGHFDDRRAALCALDQQTDIRCKDTFVVDQIVALDGEPVGVTTSEDLVVANDTGGTTRLQPVSMVGDIDRLVADVDPSVVILSRRVVVADRLRNIEPGVGSGHVEADAVWSVVAVDASSGQQAVPRTFLVPDGSQTVMEMTDDNRVSLALPTSRPDQTVLCGRLNPDRCAAAIALVRAGHPRDVEAAWKVAVDDLCPPEVACDRRSRSTPPLSCSATPMGHWRFDGRRTRWSGWERTQSKYSR
jgi:hypothetical protein